MHTFSFALMQIRADPCGSRSRKSINRGLALPWSRDQARDLEHQHLTTSPTHHRNHTQSQAYFFMYASYTDGKDDLVLPTIITRDDFADKPEFDPDAFLYDNHRFTSLDSLLRDLKKLSENLNQDLLDLVNSEYTSFIQLGQSIGGCLELINNISLDVGKFNQQLVSSKKNMADSRDTAQRALEQKKRLNLLKNKAKLVLLLNEQCTSFETLLGLDIGELSVKRLQPKLLTLTTLYLSATKIYAILDEAHEEGCVFFEKSLKPKLLSLQLEFKAYIKETLDRVRKEPKGYDTVIMSLLHCQRIVGSSS